MSHPPYDCENCGKYHMSYSGFVEFENRLRTKNASVFGILFTIGLVVAIYGIINYDFNSDINYQIVAKFKGDERITIELKDGSASATYDCEPDIIKWENNKIFCSKGGILEDNVQEKIKEMWERKH